MTALRVGAEQQAEDRLEYAEFPTANVAVITCSTPPAREMVQRRELGIQTVQAGILDLSTRQGVCLHAFTAPLPVMKSSTPLSE